MRATHQRRHALLATLTAACLIGPAQAVLTTTLTGPAWEIAVSDYGYSDYLGDLTPGFQGREYLSGEWGGAIGYARNGSTKGPTWLEPDFIYPDWRTNSNFSVISPMALGANNAYGLPTASSVIGNGDLRITQNLQIIDTVTGVAMGNVGASAGGVGAALRSNRYVLQQSYTFENVTDTTLQNLQFFQFLHGLTAQSGVYDNRAYGGALADYRHDVTLGGDAGATAGQFDYIGFHSRVAPSAVEIGHYGIEGIDDHGVGKPSVGTHLSVEANALSGVDSFAPTVRWVAGAQRFELGTLAVNQSVTFDVVLSILTGYQVGGGGGGGGGSIGGGSTNSGGVDYEFQGTHDAGQFFISFAREDAQGVAEMIAAGDIGPLTFALPGNRLPLWEIEYDGSFAGLLKLTFGFDPSLLPGGLPLDSLHIFHWTQGRWIDLGGGYTVSIDGQGVAHGTISVLTDSLSPFALGVVAVPEPATGALVMAGLLFVLRRARRACGSR